MLLPFRISNTVNQLDEKESPEPAEAILRAACELFDCGVSMLTQSSNGSGPKRPRQPKPPNGSRPRSRTGTDGVAH
jgi:hypothetical protein